MIFIMSATVSTTFPILKNTHHKRIHLAERMSSYRTKGTRSRPSDEIITFNPIRCSIITTKLSHDQQLTESDESSALVRMERLNYEEKGGSRMRLFF